MLEVKGLRVARRLLAGALVFPHGHMGEVVVVSAGLTLLRGVLDPVVGAGRLIPGQRVPKHHLGERSGTPLRGQRARLDHLGQQSIDDRIQGRVRKVEKDAPQAERVSESADARRRIHRSELSMRSNPIVGELGVFQGRPANRIDKHRAR